MNCDPLLVTKQDKYVAVLITCKRKGSSSRLRRLRIRNSHPAHVKDGAVGALCYFSISCFHGKGFKKVNSGRSRAFLRDGMLHYKRKWNDRIVGASPNGLALKILSHSEAVKRFLQQNPFISERNGALNGEVFVDKEKTIFIKNSNR